MFCLFHLPVQMIATAFFLPLEANHRVCPCDDVLTVRVYLILRVETRVRLRACHVQSARFQSRSNFGDVMWCCAHTLFMQRPCQLLLHGQRLSCRSVKLAPYLRLLNTCLQVCARFLCSAKLLVTDLFSTDDACVSEITRTYTEHTCSPNVWKSRVERLAFYANWSAYIKLTSKHYLSKITRFP